MAQSRLEKIGTIFMRVQNLVKGGVLKKDELPIWYAVYEAFPPKYEPRFDRPGSIAPLSNIYYTEDLIRAKFYKDFPGLTNPALSSNEPTKCQQFIEEYRKLEKEGIPENEIYDKTREIFSSKLETDRERTTSTRFEEVKPARKQKRAINILDLMKE
ncbi:28S ribosomal protein S23, mitochondrial [Leptopilina heterotoma]|uniref:28S ribosomal protein S23, mitochondrial n=1 Tax=Leptopilina heterotoma TaxID=63436 RepID=UPI001CA9B9DF|nr:28S ribosomal protein S23, mitochondrial [Leptopilina heterotoma]